MRSKHECRGREAQAKPAPAAQPPIQHTNYIAYLLHSPFQLTGRRSAANCLHQLSGRSLAGPSQRHSALAPQGVLNQRGVSTVCTSHYGGWRQPVRWAACARVTYWMPPATAWARIPHGPACACSPSPPTPPHPTPGGGGGAPAAAAGEHVRPTAAPIACAGVDVRSRAAAAAAAAVAHAAPGQRDRAIQAAVIAVQQEQEAMQRQQAAAEAAAAERAAAAGAAGEAGASEGGQPGAAPASGYEPPEWAGVPEG